MRSSLSLLVLAVLLGLGRPASAQAVVDVRATCDTAGSSTCQVTPRTVFRADDSGSLLATGILGIGVIPASGAGERMMWHGYKAAFRAGSIGSSGTQWDDPNVGFYTAAFGYNTIARGLAGFAAGYQSTASGSYSVGMGYRGIATGTGAVAIGYRSTARADYSVAIGQRASSNGHAGAIVFSDGSTTDSTLASANNQFTVRAAGGYRLFTNAARTTGVTLSAGGSSWNVVSDRDAKEAFTPLDAEALLQRLAQLPLSTWRYRDAGTDERHVGPMAQDWQALVDGPLGLNADDLTINQGDFDGVNLAGIVALEARTRALAEENAALRAELEALRADRAELRAERAEDGARLARLETTLARLVPADDAPVTITVAATGGEAQP